MYTTKQPDGEWLTAIWWNSDLKIPNMRVEEYEPVKRKQLLGKAFDTHTKNIIAIQLEHGIKRRNPLVAMGVTPLAVLSDKRRPLFDYFKQPLRR